MKRVFIICNNDDIRYAVIDDEGKAKSIKDKMEKEDTEKKERGQYMMISYWHIHEVQGE